MQQNISSTAQRSLAAAYGIWPARASDLPQMDETIAKTELDGLQKTPCQENGQGVF
jgi:hypothetical protein